MSVLNRPHQHRSKSATRSTTGLRRPSEGLPIGVETRRLQGCSGTVRPTRAVRSEQVRLQQTDGSQGTIPSEHLSAGVNHQTNRFRYRSRNHPKFGRDAYMNGGGGAPHGGWGWVWTGRGGRHAWLLLSVSSTDRSYSLSLRCTSCLASLTCLLAGGHGQLRMVLISRCWVGEVADRVGRVCVRPCGSGVWCGVSDVTAIVVALVVHMVYGGWWSRRLLRGLELGHVR